MQLDVPFDPVERLLVTGKLRLNLGGTMVRNVDERRVEIVDRDVHT